MKSLVCSIKNSDTEEFGALLLFPSQKVAEAQFRSWVDKQSEENKYFDGSDYSLHIIATFDSSTGAITKQAKVIVIEPFEKE